MCCKSFNGDVALESECVRRYVVSSPNFHARDPDTLTAVHVLARRLGSRPILISLLYGTSDYRGIDPVGEVKIPSPCPCQGRSALRRIGRLELSEANLMPLDVEKRLGNDST